MEYLSQKGKYVGVSSASTFAANRPQDSPQPAMNALSDIRLSPRDDDQTAPVRSDGRKIASILPNSSNENLRLASAATFCSICSTRLAPISAEVMRLIAQNPCQRHLRQTIVRARCDFVQCVHLRQAMLVDVFGFQESVRLGWRASRRECRANSGRSAGPAPADKMRFRRCLLRPRTSSRPSSTQRSNSEYLG